MADVKEKIILTFEQLRELGKEIEDTSREAFLARRGAIKVREGVWSVMQYDGLATAGVEACYGYIYRTDIPYSFWNEILRQVDTYLYRKEQRQKAENAGLEEIAEQGL